jgi:predicted xylose isomerase-like sugar epimerase
MEEKRNSKNKRPPEKVIAALGRLSLFLEEKDVSGLEPFR